MRKSLIAILISLILACLLTPGLFADEKRPVTIEDIFTLKDISEVELSPDGRMIAFLSNRDEESQIWLISPFAGEAHQLTDSKTGVSTFAWSPCGKKIAYLAPQPPTEEEEKRKKEKEDVIVVGKEFKMNCLWLIDVATKEVKQLTKGDFHITSFEWSPKGDQIAFSAQPTPKVPDSFNSDLYLISLPDGEPQKLVGRPGPDSDPCWGPEGKSIYFLGPTGITYNLFRISAAGG